MNKPTVQDIFQCFYPAYLEKYSPSPEQAKVARNILNCKTGAYGANVSVCEDCGAVQVHYNSCRNRCCPMCQAVPKEIWMDARREDVLDAHSAWRSLASNAASTWRIASAAAAPMPRPLSGAPTSA